MHTRTKVEVVTPCSSGGAPAAAALDRTLVVIVVTREPIYFALFYASFFSFPFLIGQVLC